MVFHVIFHVISHEFSRAHQPNSNVRTYRIQMSSDKCLLCMKLKVNGKKNQGDPPPPPPGEILVNLRTKSRKMQIYYTPLQSQKSFVDDFSCDLTREVTRAKKMLRFTHLRLLNNISGLNVKS